MLSCKEVTSIVSQSLDRKLPLRQFMAVRIHLMMCKFCSRYRKQLLFLRGVAGQYSLHNERLWDAIPVTLSWEARGRIRHMLSKHLHDSQNDS